MFKLSGKIPVVKDKLYMKHRYSAVCSLANFNIFMGMPIIPIALLQSRLDIVSIISFLVQGDIRNDSIQNCKDQVRSAKTNAVLKCPVNKLFSIESTYNTNQTDKAREQKLRERQS